MIRISNNAALLPAHPFLLLLTALCAGILLRSGIPGAAPLLWFLCCLCAAIAALALQLYRSIQSGIPPLRMFCLSLAFLFLGATLSSLQDVRSNKRWYGHYLEHADVLAVSVIDDPQPKARTVLLPVKVERIRRQGRWITVKGLLQLYLYKKDSLPAFRPGQQWLIPAKLSRIKASGNPHAFDYAAYAARQGIFYQAFLSPGDICLLQDAHRSTTPLASLRRGMAHCLDATVNDSITRSLIAATVLNERATLDEQLWQAYSVTGIVHIIAISGMHIVLLAAFILLLFKWLPFPRLNPVKYLLAIAAVWFYVALTAFPPSAVRAAVMFSLGIAGLLLHRNSPPVNTWAAAGFLLLCYNPDWLYDIGVQLSFLAVLSIHLFYPALRSWYRPAGRIGAWLRDAVAISLAAQVLVAPLVIYYFHQFPLLGLIANLPAALFSMLLLLYGSACLFLLYAVGLPCQWLGTALGWFTDAFNGLVRALAACTPAGMQALHIDAFEYWLMMMAIVGICLSVRYKSSRYLFAGGLCCLFLLGDFIIKDQVALGQKRVVVYNASRISLADVFDGRHSYPVYGDSQPDRKTEQYTRWPARLAFRAIDTASTSPQQVYRIGGRRILFLDRSGSITPGNRFPVDFLVVSSRCAFDPEAWYFTFHPGKIIIDGSLPRWKALQWRQQLNAYGAKVHWVQEDGAWVYPPLP